MSKHMRSKASSMQFSFKFGLQLCNPAHPCVTALARVLEQFVSNQKEQIMSQNFTPLVTARATLETAQEETPSSLGILFLGAVQFKEQVGLIIII